MKINVGIHEGYIRILMGAICVGLGTHTLWAMVTLLPMGLFLLFTGATSSCPVNRLMHINSKAAQEHFYLTFLPLYNPEPVFIFDRHQVLTYSNESAIKEFTKVNRFLALTHEFSDEYQTIIEDEKTVSTTITRDNTVFTLIIRGSKEVGGVVVYAADSTDLYNLDQEIIETQKEIVFTMGEIGESRSKETGNHVRRVAEYSKLLGKLSGFKNDEAELLRMASPMHDIGKVGIPDSILLKPGKLTSEEFDIMKTHAELGFDMLNHSTRPILKAAAIVAQEHHEKWNGKGYPKGSSGEDIHLYGRITAIADVFDALGSDRVYKNAWPLEKILNLLVEERGNHFDPNLIDLFLENLDEFLKIRDQFTDTM